MKLKYRLLKIFILLLLLGCMMNFSYHHFQDKPIKNLQVNIIDSSKYQFITKNMLNNMLRKNTVDSLPPIKNIDIQEFEQEIKHQAFVDSTNAYLDLDGSIHVYLKQKHPIVRVKTPTQQFYLDSLGNVLPLSKNYSPAVMIVEGNIHPNEFKNLSEIAQVISDDKLLKNHLIGIKKQSEKNFNLLLNISAYDIEFGDLNNGKDKLTNLKQFYKQYLNFVGIDEYKKISLKYNNQIVATKRHYVPKEIKTSAPNTPPPITPLPIVIPTEVTIQKEIIVPANTKTVHSSTTK